jgi:hypothetical protein
MTALTLVPSTKICSKCEIEKLSSDFYVRKSGIIRSQCKSCEKESAHSWNKANREKYRLNGRNEYKQNKRNHKNRKLKAEYGITVDEYESKLISQNFSCSICKTHQSELKYSLNVDHDHLTNEVRDLLCSPCNQLLGLAKENKEILNASIDYLKRFKK